MIDTIRDETYNHKERSALYAEYKSLSDKHSKMLEFSDSIDDDDEYDEYFETIYAVSALKKVAYLKCFAAQFHKCRNSWFAKVVDELPEDGRYKRISEKQYCIFKRYAYDEDRDNWRTGESYCRVGNYLITLVWHNALRAIKKEVL